MMISASASASDYRTVYADLLLCYRDLQVERPEQVADLIRRALKYIPVDRLVLSSDCGFGREGMSRRIAFYKMVSIVRGANIIRKELRFPEAPCLAGDAKRNALMCNGLSTLSRTFVWLGQLAVPYEASTIDYRMFVKVTGPDMQRDAEAYCSTISVGTCVLQVLTLRGLDDIERLRPPFDSAFWSPLTMSLWPIVSSALDWPPSAVMDAQTHSRFIDRWRARQNGT
jgi:hypothetical protein